MNIIPMYHKHDYRRFIKIQIWGLNFTLVGGNLLDDTITEWNSKLHLQNMKMKFIPIANIMECITKSKKSGG